MIRRTITTFELPITDEMDPAEYRSLVAAINELQPNGHVSGGTVSGTTYEITVEKVDAP